MGKRYFQPCHPDRSAPLWRTQRRDLQFSSRPASTFVGAPQFPFLGPAKQA